MVMGFTVSVSLVSLIHSIATKWEITCGLHIVGILYTREIAAFVRGRHDIAWLEPRPPAWYYSTLWGAAYMMMPHEFFAGDWAWGPTSDLNPLYQKEMKKYVARFGYEPTPHWAIGYDPANALCYAMDKVGFDPEKIRDKLENMKGELKTVSGKAGTAIDFTREHYHSVFWIDDFGVCYHDKKGNVKWSQ